MKLIPDCLLCFVNDSVISVISHKTTQLQVNTYLIWNTINEIRFGYIFQLFLLTSGQQTDKRADKIILIGQNLHFA